MDFDHPQLRGRPRIRRLLPRPSPLTGTRLGRRGTRIIALVAERFLDPAVREKIAAMLAADPPNLTAHDIASEATWADRYRDSDRSGSRQHYAQTRQWHFVDVELTNPNLDAACVGHPPLPAGTVASNGPAQACVVDKAEQFAAEIADRHTDPKERLAALKFVLHLVGDLHQPLHAADDLMPVEIENASSRMDSNPATSIISGIRNGSVAWGMTPGKPPPR